MNEKCSTLALPSLEATFIRLSKLGQNKPIDFSFRLPKKFYSFDENSADKIKAKKEGKKGVNIPSHALEG